MSEKRSKISTGWPELLYPILGVAVFVLLWQLAAACLVRAEYILPTPLAVARALAENAGLLWQHSLYTLAEAALGLGLSVLLSVAIAALISSSPLLHKISYPLLLGSQMVPIIVLAPLFLIWFGYGMLPKVLVVILICFFPVTINVMAGLAAAGGETLAYYRLMSADKARLFRLVRLPYALPYFFSGLRVAATYSVMGAVIGEWLGAQAGLGLLLTRAQRSFDLPLVFAAIVAIIVWSALLFALVRLAEHYLLGWQKAAQAEKWDQ
ncbi:MAG: ABC transporter permease [Bacillota bacterium]|nr:ABC transporter permease [Bacillota bacterium]